MSKNVAIEAAKRAAGISAIWVGIAALALLVAAAPAEAGKKQKKAAAAQPVVEIDNAEPMTLIVSVGQQKIDIYRGAKLVTSSAVSTGTAAHPTMIGAFSILEKRRWHHSNMYSNAPMPWMNRITWSGTALHAGVVPGYPASHGCIRLLYSFAPKLFQMTTKGDNVVVSRGRPKPTLIDHPNLFQPLPPPPPPVISEVSGTKSAQAGSSPAPAVVTTGTVILARVETSTRVDSEGHRPAEATDTETDSPEDGPYAADADGARGDEETAAPPASPQIAGPRVVPLATLKIDAGIEAAAVEAAEPRSEAPLRMLFTRRTQRDRIIGVQQIFAAMGYLPLQNFDGTMGKATIGAIKTFQKEYGMRETGAFNDALVKKVYEVAGKGEPPAGHLFVRQEFGHVFEAPVSFRNPDEPLGTHVYIALKFAPGATNAKWVAIDVQDGDESGPLDRIEIPDDVRRRISERLTPGSTFIIADTSINSANLPKGGDFVVLAKSSGAKVSNTDVEAPKVRTKPRRRDNVVRRNYYYNNSPRWSRGPFFGRPW